MIYNGGKPWSDDDYDVLTDGIVVGRIMKAMAAPEGTSWLWTSLALFLDHAWCPPLMLPDCQYAQYAGALSAQGHKRGVDLACAAPK